MLEPLGLVAASASSCDFMVFPGGVAWPIRLPDLGRWRLWLRPGILCSSICLGSFHQVSKETQMKTAWVTYPHRAGGPCRAVVLGTARGGHGGLPAYSGRAGAARRASLGCSSDRIPGSGGFPVPGRRRFWRPPVPGGAYSIRRWVAVAVPTPLCLGPRGDGTGILLHRIPSVSVSVHQAHPR